LEDNFPNTGNNTSFTLPTLNDVVQSEAFLKKTFVFSLSKDLLKSSSELSNSNSSSCSSDSDVSPSSNHSPLNEISTPAAPLMDAFPNLVLNDFKHIVYNLLTENFNNPKQSNLAEPYFVQENGVSRTGFRFNPESNPDKAIPELYAKYIRKSDLTQENYDSIFTQDLYKFYFRASMELMSKYFEKKDKYTYLDEEVQLFIPGGSLEEAEVRIKLIKARSRRKRKYDD